MSIVNENDQEYKKNFKKGLFEHGPFFLIEDSLLACGGSNYFRILFFLFFLT